jgi:uncharacterized protein YhaN
MIIERLDLKAFGRFSDTSLDLSAGPRRFHLVYGPNESGKSTCLRAIASLLFGIPKNTSDNFLHANPKLRIGATLADESEGRLSIIRRKGVKSTLLASDGETAVDPARLTAMLGGIDEAAFYHRFGLSHQQLVAGGQAVLASRGELGEILFAAGAGVGRLKAVQNELEVESKEIFLERGKKTINLLLKELEEKRKELRDLQTLPAEYRSLKSELAETETHSRELADGLTTINRRLAKRKAYREAHQIVPVWRREKARLSELESVPMLDQEFAARRREAWANRQTYQKWVNDRRTELQTLEQAIDACGIDLVTIEHEREIVSLFQGIAARQAASNDQNGLHRVVKNSNRHLRELLRDLGIDVAETTDPSAIDLLIDELHVSDAAQIRISELAGDYEMLRQQERDSLESLQTLRKQFADLDDELHRTPSGCDPKLIDSVLTDIGAPAALLELSDQQQAICHELETECERLMRELRLTGIDGRAAALLQIPSPGEIDQHDALMADHQRACRDAETTLEQLNERYREASEELERLSGEQPLPTEEELSQSREQRDQLVDRLESAVENGDKIRTAATAARRSIRTADDVVDTIRFHHEQVARRSAVEREGTRLKLAIAEAETRLKIAQDREKEALRDWHKLLVQLGIPEQSVRAMRTWVSTHATLIDKFHLLEKSRERLAIAERRLQRSVSRLGSALERACSARPVTAGLEEFERPNWSEMGIEALHDRATLVRDELAAAASHAEHLRRRRSEVHSAIPSSEAKYEACVDRRKRWDADWERAVGAYTDQQELGPSVVGRRLKKIAEMFEEKRDRDIVIGRIRSIDNDNQSFAERVSVVAQLVGLDSSPDRPSVETAQLLYERLQAAKAAFNERSGMQKDLASGKQRLGRDTEMLQAAIGQLAGLCQEAGATSAEDLPAIEERAAEKRALTAAVANAEKQLLLIAGDDSVQRFADQVQTHDVTELEAEISALEHSLQTLSRQRSEIDQKLGVLKKELSAIDGGDRAAELNQGLQFLTGRIERQTQHYAKLRVASMILNRSIEHYRRENESPVLKLACEAFEELTCGRYSGLKPEYDEKGRSKLFGVHKPEGEEESLVPVDAMSLGTADALYLAMRLASLEHQLSAGHAIPVVIDDCLIQLDDDRAAAAMQCLSRLSERTQVILFTHHQHLIELASSSLSPGEYHLHRLVE